MRRTMLLVCLWCLVTVGVRADEPAGGPITSVEFQPLSTATTRLLSALQFQGTPLPEADTASLQQILQTGSGRDGVIAIQKLLDPHCLALVRINPEGRVSVAPGPVPKQLIQQGWRTFLVKVHNEAGVTAELKVGSPQSGPLGGTGWLALEPTGVPWHKRSDRGRHRGKPPVPSSPR